MTAFVLLVIFSLNDSGIKQYVSASTSQNTGIAPRLKTAVAVATNVNAGTITSSPGITPNTSSAISRACVPFETPNA